MVKNTFKVNARKWHRWSQKARHVFNEVYDQMVGSPWAFQHPKVAGGSIRASQWTTTAWNAAWVAADAADKTGFDLVQDCDRRGKPVGGLKRLKRAA